MAFAFSSEDITLGQSFLHLLDQRFGGKARGFLVVVASIIPTIVGILNAVVEHADWLPATGSTAWISSGAAGALVFLGKFTPFFNAVIAPPAKPDAAIVVPAAEAPQIPADGPAPVVLVPAEPIVLEAPPAPPVVALPPPPPALLIVPKPVPVAQPVE